MKESKYRPSPQIVFSETFESEQSTRNMNGVPSNVTYSNGVGIFNGTNSYILYGTTIPLKGSYSIRIKFNGSNSLNVYQYLWLRSGGTGSSAIQANGTLTSTSGTQYVNGIATSTFNTGNVDYVVTEIVCDTPGIFIGGYGSQGLSGSIELIEIYKGTLSSQEVSNLYNNKRYVLPKLNEVLNIDGKNGVIMNKFSNSGTIPNIINTSVTPVRQGNVWGMDFNGSTSRLDAGSYNSLVGDKTFVFWLKAENILNTPRVLDNGTFRIFINTSGSQIGITSNGVTNALPLSNSLFIGIYVFVVISRTSLGVTNFYLNGISNGGINQSSGTPTAGTTNLCIGNRSANDRGFDGILSGVRIIDSILSQEEISQIYTAERSLYNV